MKKNKPQNPRKQNGQAFQATEQDLSSQNLMKKPLIIITFIVLIIVSFFLGRASNDPNIISKISSLNPSPTPQISKEKTTYSNNEFALVDTKVIRKIDDQETTIFTNVVGVDKIKIGPDGKTIHFRPTDQPAPNQPYCVILPDNLNSLAENNDSPPNSPPPSQLPFDFKGLELNETLKKCSSGFITGTDYFAYLKIKKSHEGSIVFEDITSDIQNQVKIDSKLLQEFSDTDGENSYYYPHDGIKIDENLILAFDQLVVAIDIVKNKFIGGENIDFAKAPFNQFVNQKSIPYILIESQKDGPPWFSAIIDISGGQFKVIDLDNLDNRSWFNFDIEPAIWEDDSIIFNFLDLVDLTDQLPQNFISDNNLEDLTDTTEINKINREAENILAETGNYEKIICDLSSGEHNTPSCQGLIRIVNYKYSSKNGLTKL